MFRRPSTLVLGAALLIPAAGCRSSCNPCPGVFTSAPGGAAPCYLTGNARPGESCFDAITGMPIPCPPQDATTVIPNGSYPYSAPPGVRPDELPYPAPSDMIPRPGVPLAPPSAAPGTGVSLPPKNGPAVKTGSDK